MLEDELAFAHALADRADAIALRLFRSGPEVRTKADRTPVTRADVEVEELVRREVRAAFPGDAVVGEEEGGELGGGRTWVVDPIDGTKNFAAGIPVWGTLLALAVDGEPAMGVVSAPAVGERYAAVRGGGATLNGEPLRVSETSSLAEATLCHYETGEWLAGPHGQALLNLIGEARRSVGFTDFWGHCLVARGAVDVMVEPSLRLWDWAAPNVVVEEAGGRMTSFDGEPPTDGGSVLSTNGALHREALAVLGRQRDG